MTQSIGVRRRNLTDEVYEIMRKRLINRLYKPGERLYLGKIAEELQVSYTPIQQAISKLEKEGLVISKPRRGVIATSLPCRDIEEIFDMRLLLELHAAKLLCAKIAPNVKIRLKRLSEEMKRLGKANSTFFEFIEKDRSFHLTIVKAAGNRKLYEIFQSIDTWMHIIRTYYMETASQKRIDDAVKEHEKICDGFQKEDNEVVGELIEKHVRAVKKAVLAGMSKQKTPL